MFISICISMFCAVFRAVSPPSPATESCSLSMSLSSHLDLVTISVARVYRVAFEIRFLCDCARINII